MHRSNRFLASLFLAAVLAAPMSVGAAALPQASLQIRVYDSNHHDYHNWDDHEDRAYRGYLEERHHTYIAYEKQSHKSQRDYWNWRHSHPDHN